MSKLTFDFKHNSILKHQDIFILKFSKTYIFFSENIKSIETELNFGR